MIVDVIGFKVLRLEGLKASTCLTQEEVEAFCKEWGIDLKFNPVALGFGKSID